MKNARVWAIGIVAGAVVLTGCAAGDEGGDLTYADSPLNEYFSAVSGSDLSEEALLERSNEQERQVQEAVAECMADEGFEYIPDTGAVTTYGAADEDMWKPDDREWVAQYGYGIVESPYGDEAVPDEASPEEVDDPNAEYVESLSAAEQEAYMDTLYGPSPTEEQMNDPDFDWDTWDRGCQGAAYESIDPAVSVFAAEEFQPLMTDLEALYASLDDAPERIELDREWSECMAEAGHGGFAKQSDAQESIMDELNAAWDDPERTGDVAESDLAAISDKEVELALADLDCREKTDYMTRALRVQFALEQQFIDEHKAELDALRAAAEQAAQ
ncbi:hypothetical protein [Microbacterium sp.]|uniref:hypothetical protein n=1 Tax=Microbacterium sp. TaxID=51671 RepID=UPI003A86B8DB